MNWNTTMNVKAILIVMLVALMMTGTASAAAPGVVMDTKDPHMPTDDGHNKDKGPDQNENDTESDDDEAADNTQQQRQQQQQQQESVNANVNGETVVVNVTNTNVNENANENINLNQNANSAGVIGLILEILNSEIIQAILEQLDVSVDGGLTIELEA